MSQGIVEVGIEELAKAGGLSSEEAMRVHKVIRQAIAAVEAKGSEPREVWQEVVSGKVLKPWHPHSLHQLVYYSVYSNWDSSTNGPPLYWFPSLYLSKLTNIGRVMETYGPKFLWTSYKDPVASFKLFRKFSVEHPKEGLLVCYSKRVLSIVFREAPK